MEKRNGSFIGRIFRFILSVVILSAFIIGIALVIKGIHNTDENKIVKAVYKVLSLAHINVKEEQVGDVAGKFVERVSNTNISAVSTSRSSSENTPSDDSKSNLMLEVAVIADVHGDLASLNRSINIIKERNINKVIVIGDLTNYGEISSLNEVKTVLDESGLKYYVLPGDHDLAASVGVDNFVQVFGKNDYVVDMEGCKFLFLDNSANFTPLLPSTVTWFSTEVKNTDFVLLSQPLYTEGMNLPFKKMFMGSTTEDPSNELIENQQRVKAQRDVLLNSIQNAPVLAVLSGDHHKSNTLSDNVSKVLKHHTLGSIAQELNGLPQSILQTPRFSILNVYEDKSFDVEDVLID